ncbi:MAG: dihydroorotate dehydrogenase electron transfer subunit [Candidatus Omnitrophota bacterium]
MKDTTAKIISNKEIAPGYFKMAIDALYIAENVLPGQFVEIRCSDGLDPFLRRPFSIHRVTPAYRQGRGNGLRVTGIEILYEVIGKGTQILSQKKKGDLLNVLGPLGNGFTLPDPRNPLHVTPILIAGGIGVAPIMYLAEILISRKIKPIVILGARSREFVLCDKDLKKLGAKVHIATDDGTMGFKGFVTELFKDFLLATCSLQLATVYSCGPNPMLKVIVDICKKHDIESQVSLEEKMACGIGACLGCAVKIKENRKIVYKLTCKDGPVFCGNNIVWEEQY